MKHHVSILPLVLVALAATLAAQTPDYARIRTENARELTQPFGWFSLIGLELLKPGATTVGSASGSNVLIATAPPQLMTLVQASAGVTVTTHAPSLRLHGDPVHVGDILPEDEQPASALTCGTLRFWVINRGGKRYLRIKDSHASALLHFHGLNWYAPDMHFRVEARWVPYTTPHTMSVLNKLGQVTPVPAPGYVEFTLNGQRQTLTPMTASATSLFFVFRDSTYLQTTDGGGRFLSTDAPSNGLAQPGTVILDFNLAENPPCAYSPYATCPLASPENRLPLDITAGEKRYE